MAHFCHDMELVLACATEATVALHATGADALGLSQLQSYLFLNFVIQPFMRLS